VVNQFAPKHWRWSQYANYCSHLVAALDGFYAHPRGRGSSIEVGQRVGWTRTFMREPYGLQLRRT
jgi:hypothetical protein